jgi:hypothetical protein
MGDEPVFRKAGYTITPEGIVAMPQQYKKQGLPAGESLRTLKVVAYMTALWV